MKKEYTDAKSYARETLDAFYEMDDKIKKHLFGNNVKRVFVGYGENGEKAQSNSDEFTLPTDSGIVIEFNDGRCFSVYPFDNKLQIEVNTDLKTDTDKF
ncbi:hypothetical protein [uncultured Tenacibaculum sp.]|uniref:hypothetical protein n=1 Tax=uncultured Tenacibaculum sp. TaxID=174713 RepID=UPI0026395C93|nr:hypothetical protein [uncultured Tenacibaculum sp.]